jgi:hypothetical protein
LLLSAPVPVLNGPKRWRWFKTDPESLALRLGAREVDPQADPSHRRLQGLVEALALAAQLPVPRPMVIEHGEAIEAFALGWSRTRTVMVVSRGALNRLSRQELNGLLALAMSRVMTGEVRPSTWRRMRLLSRWSFWLRPLLPASGGLLPAPGRRLGDPHSPVRSEPDIVAHLADEAERVHRHLHAPRPGDEPIGRLLRSVQDSAGAAALLVALLQDLVPSHSPVWGRDWREAGQRFPAVVALLAALEPQARVALRWPLTELALARMQDLEQAPRRALLMLLREVLDQSGECQPRAWIDFALMTRRLAPELSPSTLRAPGAEPVAARHVRVLCAVFACLGDVHEVRADRMANGLIRDLGLDPVGGTPGPLVAPAFGHALAQLARLPVQDRERLVQALPMMLATEPEPIVREWLRLLRLVLDAPTGRPARLTLPESLLSQ